jgi:hypothetical protein
VIDRYTFGQVDLTQNLTTGLFDGTASGFIPAGYGLTCAHGGGITFLGGTDPDILDYSFTGGLS